MADITDRNQGNVSGEGQVNWRGDQVTVAQGGQSVFDSSSVQLADLGSRKVVGDRVFRYAKAGVAVSAGAFCRYNGETLVSTAVGGAVTQPAGLKTFTITAATAIVKDTYAEGYILCVAGATDSNLGMIYKIKSNALGSSAGTCVLTLFDEIKYTVKLTSTWRVAQSPYINVSTSNAAAADVGVAPIALTTSDFFWLQTWGPANVYGSGAGGNGLVSSVSGRGSVMVATTGALLGAYAETLAGAQGLVFLTIAP
mgnify:CR=1 FL=1